ncbi:hypothetical protein COJ90_21020 [Priestia megaterium]|uniref:DUF2971 domain-containing protein n=1 Tax=Priestia megaterium TaxID=1404 RepID=UPI000BF514BC|nr:DUF2971 domain-containing protein [Priestia megaterium]PFP09388.1 hypothetical protein COJ90_21020 [Priestia megaterium]
MKERDWKDEYVEKMFGIHSTEEEVQSALALKDQHIPKSLYKYRAFDEYSVRNFREQTLWFNLAKKMNDPYDSALTVNQEKIVDMAYKASGREEMVREELARLKSLGLSEDKIKESEEEFHAILQEEREKINSNYEKNQDKIPGIIQDSTFISCFSERNDSMLMWSHYTDNHKGFCLEYEFMKPENIEVEPIFKEALNPVIYSDEMFDMSDYILYAAETKQPWSQRVAAHPVIRKSKEWEYEKEWRLVQFHQDRKEGYPVRFFKPKAIYLGAKISEEHKDKLMLLADYKHIDVYQMKIKPNAFKLIAHLEESKGFFKHQ